jgi:hypothetical protein
MLASILLAKKKEKEILARGIALKTTRDIFKAAERKETKELKILRVADRKAKREQKKWLNKQYVL